jgi:predicted  nucleic acid-binding Zn-ribbon protein
VLEDLNQHTLSLSREFDTAQCKIASLESELASLLHSLDKERKKSASLQSSSNQMEENATMKENKLACMKVEQLEKELINTRAETQALNKRPAERRQIMKASLDIPIHSSALSGS